MPLASVVDSQQQFHWWISKVALSMEVFACYFGGDDPAITVNSGEPGLLLPLL